ncbi:MAG: hypothetical protein WD669_05085 [Pirellulales bacterium]
MRQLVIQLCSVRCAATVIGASALLALLAPSHALADDERRGARRETLVLLLHGIYEPVVEDPDLGLSSVDLDDGTYSKCDILRLSGGPRPRSRRGGSFYVNFDVTLCAYELPGGAFAAVFDEFVYEIVEIGGELYQVGTAELTISEANGSYRSFEGGTIHMEFITRMIDEVTFDEFCICFIRR